MGSSPVDLDGRLVLDVGAGTGPVAGRWPSTPPAGMLGYDRSNRPPTVLADARALPVRDGGAGAVVAAFSLNHLPDPAAGLREAARVVARGGAVLASAYAADDTHPVKQAVEAALRSHGWSPPT